MQQYAPGSEISEAPGAGRSRRAVLRDLGAGGGAALTLSAGALLAAGCSAGGGGAAGDGAPQLSKSPVTVTAFVGITDIQINRFPDEIGTPFKAKYPNVTLSATPQTGAGTQ